MPPRKRSQVADAAVEEPVAKRRSARQSAATPSKLDTTVATKREPDTITQPLKRVPKKKEKATIKSATKPSPADEKKSKTGRTSKDTAKPATAKTAVTDSETRDSARAVSEDPDPKDIPTHNPEAEKHEGTWYWLLKAEPETRIENGIDISFSIDDLRSKTKPEGWDGIRAYAARNNLRAMNAGDMAFFYHSNCKTPGIVGTMEIVKEFSEDKSARRPGTPYYDPSSTREKPRWSLVHVEFRRKFAVPILLPELRSLGQPGQPLEMMQMLRQGRLSVSKVAASEWQFLCELADKKAKEAGLEHEDP